MRVIPKSLVSIVALSVLSAAAATPLQYGGIVFSPGSTVKANVPLNAQEKSLASQGGGKRCPAECGGRARYSFEF